MRFKIRFDNDPSLGYIYQTWFKEMGFDEADVFELVDDVPNREGVMTVRHVKSGRTNYHAVHKHMLVTLEPTTKLEDWI